MKELESFSNFIIIIIVIIISSKIFNLINIKIDIQKLNSLIWTWSCLTTWLNMFSWFIRSYKIVWTSEFRIWEFISCLCHEKKEIDKKDKYNIIWENEQTLRQFQRKRKILLIARNYIVFVEYKILYKKRNQNERL